MTTGRERSIYFEAAHKLQGETADTVDAKLGRSFYEYHTRQITKYSLTE